VETRAIGLVPYHMMVSRYKLDSVTYEGICEQASQDGYDLLVMLRNDQHTQRVGIQRVQIRQRSASNNHGRSMP